MAFLRFLLQFMLGLGRLRRIIKIIFFFVGLNFVLTFFFITRMARIKIEAASATTPPSLDGIDRRMTYANRKYHSGWMCTGVTRGFAGLKFSTSPSKLGVFEIIIMNKIEIRVPGSRSFTEKEG